MTRERRKARSTAGQAERFGLQNCTVTIEARDDARPPNEFFRSLADTLIDLARKKGIIAPVRVGNDAA